MSNSIIKIINKPSVFIYESVFNQSVQFMGDRFFTAIKIEDERKLSELYRLYNLNYNNFNGSDIITVEVISPDQYHLKNLESKIKAGKVTLIGVPDVTISGSVETPNIVLTFKIEDLVVASENTLSGVNKEENQQLITDPNRDSLPNWDNRPKNANEINFDTSKM